MKKYCILFVFILFTSQSIFSQSIDDLLLKTNAFLSTLTQEQLHSLNLEFSDTLRTKWTNLPVGLAKRPGIRYGTLSTESRIAFHHILSTLLSSQGYLKTTSIMKLDDILNEVYETAYANKEIDDNEIEKLRNLKWNFENYFISVWGTPNKLNTWGIKFEGHHISINLTAVGDKFSVTPLFMGTDPAEVHSTKYAGLRILNKEEDYGFHLINSLSEEQKAVATLSQDVPGDIITNPNFKGRLTEYQGIKASALNTQQKQLLEYIIEEYVNNLEHEKAAEYLNKITKSGLDNIYFAWIGSFQHQKPHYYIINGPDFIIEYDNVGFQKNGNHIHSIWREKGNDFGEDLLKEHYLTEHKN